MEPTPDPLTTEPVVQPSLSELEEMTPAEPTGPTAIAPAWHTLLLIAGILALSIGGSTHLTAQRHSANKLFTYATTSAMELLMLGWVALGLKLRKVPFRTLYGDMARGIQGFAMDLGIAALFWMGSMVVLGSIGLVWTVTEYAATHKHLPTRPGQKMEPSPAQKQTIQTLTQLAPSNGQEIAIWVLVCCLAGFIEETVFRGYLQSQFIAWSKGNAAIGVVFSAIMFGAAHGYQGVRNMVMLGVFGVLFSLLALARRTIRSGIFAHAWHDLFVGLMLAALHALHRI